MPALIPLIAVLVSAAFAAVSMAWRSDQRATGSMTPLFACTGAWSFLELLAATESDPTRAIFWLRWILLPALLLGPITVSLLVEVLPNLAPRLRGAIRWGTAFAFIGGIAAGLMPGSVERITPTAGGAWLLEYGWFGTTLIPLGFVLPLFAAWLAIRSAPSVEHADGSEADRRTQQRAALSARVLSVVVWISLTAAFLTEFIFPLLAIPAPRMGAICVASAAALAWLGVLHASDDLGVTSHGLARAMLAQLQDSVVLIQLDGTIVSSNPRFEEMTGQPNGSLIGGSLVDWVDLSADTLCAGFESREVTMRTARAAAFPLSMSSTVTRSPSGNATGAVIVLRDVSEVESLRRSLLSSGRLAAIGELAAGIAHEVNNPVAFVRSDLNLLARRLAEIREYVDDAAKLDSTAAIFSRGEQRISQAREATDYVAQVVGDVRGFAHLGGQGQGGSEPVPLLEVALRLAGLQRGDEVALVVRRAECNERIQYGQELKQILLSLMRTLIDAAEIGACVEISMGGSAEALQVEIAADSVAGEPGRLVSRFEAASAAAEDAEEAEVELAIAVGLVAELGGTIQVAASGAGRVEVQFELPLSAGEDE